MWWMSKSRLTIANLDNFSSIAIAPVPMPDMSHHWYITGSEVPGEMFVVDGPFDRLESAQTVLAEMMTLIASSDVTPDKFG